MASDLLSGAEVADLVGISRTAVCHAVRRGKLVPDAFTANGKPRFTRATVKAWREAVDRHNDMFHVWETAPWRGSK